MSHASVLVAVDVVDPNDREEIEAAVTFQMAPYDENGECFADGSRWDWWVIGGRYTGKLNPAYDPDKDPRNFQTCTLCAGTGVRKDMQVRNGCNGCRGTGIERKWNNAPVDFDVMQVKDLNLDEIRKGREQQLRELYQEAAEKAKTEPGHPFALTYGFDPRQLSEADYIAPHLKSPICAYAFLRNRHWHEGERLGWFGCTTATECERKADGDADVLTRRCVTTGDENCKIVVWNEPNEIWAQNFYHRFIEPLPKEAVLVVVDYHV